jgi:uncharacterized OB-fold protein
VPDLADVAFTMEFPYTRTTGPVIGPFLTGLRDGHILGVRCGDRVLCPPLEYDPATGASLVPEFVEVGPGGVVTSWTWVASPTSKHPFDHPFAFALIRLDGADTTIMHAVDAGSPEAVTTGTRVVARYREERKGAITDVYFVPEASAAPSPVIIPGDEPVRLTEHLISLKISEPLQPARARFVRGLLEGKIIGQRSPASGKVYVPSRGYDHLARVEMTEADDVEVSDRGAISSFTVITPVRYYGQQETEPYVRASILLDGADSAIYGVDIRGASVDDIRVGMRVQAIWRPVADRDVSNFDNRQGGDWEHVIERWQPTGEPDADPARLKEFVF